ncbi:hypothetical protein PG984_014221 [Apiospora sp. TS-2023a]
MCSTVHFTYRCGCADKVVFKCPLLHHCCLQNQDSAHHDHEQEGAGEAEQVESAASDEDGQKQALDEPLAENPVVPPIVITMTTTLDEECQDCITNRYRVTTAAKSEDDSSSSDENQQNRVPRSPPPLSVREEGEGEVVIAAAVQNMPPPPPPPRTPLLPLQPRQIPRQPRLQHRRGGFERTGLREIPLNMV